MASLASLLPSPRMNRALTKINWKFDRKAARRKFGYKTKSCCRGQASPVKIPGGTTSGISLVSFNSDAFESYGLSRNENAPVCRDCADAYTKRFWESIGPPGCCPHGPRDTTDMEKLQQQITGVKALDLSARPERGPHVPRFSTWDLIRSAAAVSGALGCTLTQNQLRRGVFRDVEELIMAIEGYIDRHNENPKPFIWTAKGTPSQPNDPVRWSPSPYYRWGRGSSQT
jgi:hypothetical protein